MIGNRIRKAREDAGITQEQCARLSGIDTSVYNRIENNKREPTASELMRILPVVKATPAYLLGMEKPAHQNGNGAAAPPAGAGEAPSATDALTLMAQAVLVMVQEQTRRSARKAKVALKRVTKRKKRAGGGAVSNCFSAACAPSHGISSAQIMSASAWVSHGPVRFGSSCC